MTVRLSYLTRLFKRECNSTFLGILIVLVSGILIPLEAGSESKAKDKPEKHNKFILEITQEEGKLKVDRIELPRECYKECINHCNSVLSNNKDILLECVKGCAAICKDDGKQAR